jgi:hypothetical protein
MPEYSSYAVEALKKYIQFAMLAGADMFEADLPFVKTYLLERLNKEDLSHCLIFQNYCDCLESLNIDFPVEWKERFANDTIELSNLLLEDRSERLLLSLDYDEYAKYRHQCFVDYFSGFSHKQFIEFIEKCIILKQTLTGRDRDYLLGNGIQMSLHALSETAPKVFSSLVSSYIEYDDIFKINPYSTINILFRLRPSKEVWQLVNAKDYPCKKLWITTYFVLLPEESVTHEETESFLEYLSCTASNELRGWLDFLEKYQKIDSKIYERVVRILLTKPDVDKEFARSLGFLFNSESDIYGSWFEVFDADCKLVFDAYIAVLKIDRHFDYLGKALKLLLERDFEFLFRVIDTICEDELWFDRYTSMPNLDFLWERASYVKNIEQLARYVLHKNDGKYVSEESVFSRLFLTHKDKVESLELTEKKQSFLRCTALNYVNDINYISLVFNSIKLLGEDFTRDLLALFVRNNNNFEHFRRLDYVLTTTCWSGSRVPILEREKNFLISLLPLFNSIELLEHRAYVEKQVEEKVRAIEHEKKRDYLESME